MLLNYNVIRSVISEPWFLSTDQAKDLTPVIHGLFNKNIDFTPKEECSLLSYEQVVSLSSGRIDKIGIVNIIGALTKYDTLCAYGMQSIGQEILKFNTDTSISAIILNIDSPGGTVAGTEELGQIIKNTSKHITAFVSDMACSAAYWLASQCNEIIANNTTARVGSIGVLSTYIDMEAYYAKEGIKIHEIIPLESRDKREDSDALKAGDYTIIKKSLSVLAEKFQAVVRAERTGVNELQLTGKVYFASDVVGSLVDSVDTLDNVVARLHSQTETNNQTNMPTSNYTAIAMAVGVSSLESVDGSITLSADMASVLETHLLAATSTSDEIATLRTSLATATTTIAELTANIETLNAAAGDAGAAVTPESDGVKNETPISTFADAFSAAKKHLDNTL